MAGSFCHSCKRQEMDVMNWNKPRRMSAGLQNFQIGRMLSNTRWDTEVFDVNAHIDRSLHLDENRRNIANMLGVNISGRDRGSEMLQIRASEQKREHKRRRDDPLWQTGHFSNQECDRRFQAQRPGKRFSRSGHRYYERRENRSDRGKLL